MKILFLYPNERDMSLVPPVFALFSALLKREGHQVRLFDCTGYRFDGKVDPDVEREKNLFFKKANPASSEGVKPKLTNMYLDFYREVESFNPQLIAMSITESTFLRGAALLSYLRVQQNIHIPTIAGGVFPTFAPMRVLQEKAIDMVCVGEGERSLIELCRNIECNKSTENIANLWIKKNNGEIIKNKPGKAIDIDQLPPLDFSIYEDDRFYRPMRGNIYRMLPVETHRGCPYTCSFCNSPSQNKLYHHETKSSFFRKKSILKIKEELEAFKNQWNGQYVFFWADTFLAWDQYELEQFCEMYSDYKIPFWCQSRPETIADHAGGKEKLRLLKNIGLHHISFGLEHGNEDFRKKVIKRNYSNLNTIAALKNPTELDIPFTINNIIGFPGETYELAMDTIEINRKIESFNLSCSTFAPYQGTDLRKVCEDNKYISPDLITPANTDISTLNMPYFDKSEITGLQKTFAMYVKFPKSRWKEIKEAESPCEKGNLIWERLKSEFTSEYFQEPIIKINKVNEAPHSRLTL